MKKIIKYRVTYYGNKNSMAWDAENARFVPSGLNLYIISYDNLSDAMQAAKTAKKKCSGWYDDIYVDSYLQYVD